MRAPQASINIVVGLFLRKATRLSGSSDAINCKTNRHRYTFNMDTIKPHTCFTGVEKLGSM
jgi:hypothetical protein